MCVQLLLFVNVNLCFEWRVGFEWLIAFHDLFGDDFVAIMVGFIGRIALLPGRGN